MKNKSSQNDPVFYTTAICSLGTILAAKNAHGLCALFLGQHKKELTLGLQDMFPQAQYLEKDPVLDDAIIKVQAYTNNPLESLDLPLYIQGTHFQKCVWEEISKIPPGHTITYTQLAERAGFPRAVRAAANACGANKLALIIPCHRVIRSDGSLGGYRWGLETKQKLLEKEAQITQ